MRLLVCGGREYNNEYMMRLFLGMYPKDTQLIHGDAHGADRLAGKIAVELGWPEPLVFPADWNKWGKAAGPIRNKQMLDEGKPDYVLAFKGGVGTKNMIKQAQAAHIEITRCP